MGGKNEKKTTNKAKTRNIHTKKNMDEEIWRSDVDLESVVRYATEHPQSINAKDERELTPLNHAILTGKLDIAQFLWEIGGRVSDEGPENLGGRLPMPNEVHREIAMLEWVFEKGILSLDHIRGSRGDDKGTLLDYAISNGRSEVAQWFWEKGGRPNLDIYRDEQEFIPVHMAAFFGDHDTLQWVFANNILPRSVLEIKDNFGNTPLDLAILEKQWKTARLLQKILYREKWWLANALYAMVITPLVIFFISYM